MIKVEVSKIFAQLPPQIDDYTIDGELLNFSSGYGYIQHIPEVVDKAQREFLELCYKLLGDKIYLSNNVHRQGPIGRYLDDSGTDLYKHWHRFMCIDEEYREWGQPYFAINLDAQKFSGDKICLNLELPELRNYFINKVRDKKISEILNDQ